MPHSLRHRIQQIEPFCIYGFSTTITRSQSKNALICARFWQRFNQTLTEKQLTQGRNWQKYAITYHDGTNYRYFCGIPAAHPMPNSFETMPIQARNYLVFEHNGSTTGLSATLSNIYRSFLPQSDYEHERSNFYHFEKYDRRFNWHDAKSLLEIWLPLK
jgi:predicted transcriptional regulator YdeE